MLIYGLYIVLSYLAGSLSSAVILCKLLRLEDPRTRGSGNPGATNVLRLYGKKIAVMTLLGDLLKGTLPILAVKLLSAPDNIVALCAFAAFCGHLYPVFFGFRGGKGVATLIGVLIGIHWLAGIGFVLTWLLIAVVFRYSSLAGLTAASLSPVYIYLINPDPWYVITVLVMAILLIWRHRSNIRNLINGREDPIGSRNS